MILTETQASQLARGADDVAGNLAGLKVDLYQTPIDLSTNPPLATFTAAIATYTGYAQGVVTWDTPSVAADGTVEVVGNLTLFKPTDAVTPNQIWGIYCTAGVGGALLFYAQFDSAPIPMISALSQILVTIRYRPATQSIVMYVA